jgi:hypothetical protein
MIPVDNRLLQAIEPAAQTLLEAAMSQLAFPRAATTASSNSPARSPI